MHNNFSFQIKNNKVGSWSDCRELVVSGQDAWEMRDIRALGSSPV